LVTKKKEKEAGDCKKISMKKILIYTDPFKGNVIPTLGIGEKLVKMGLDIHYIGVPDVTEIISGTPFSHTTVFEEYYPKGTRHEAGKINPKVITSIIRGDFDELMEKNNPSSIIFTAYNPVEAVAFYLKYKIKTFLVYCHFPINNDFSKASFTDKVKEWCASMLMDDVNLEAANILINFLMEQGYRITSLKDMLSVYEQFYNIMISSKDFLTEDSVLVRDNDLYTGPCIPEHGIFDHYYDTQKLEEEIIEKKDLGKRMIYCSLGSWADQIDKEKSQAIIESIIRGMQHHSMENHVLYISVGNLYDDYISYNSPKVAVHRWLPQMTFLKHAEAAVLHGGMGGIQESVLNETPMIVIPLGLDQFENADRVEANGLGFRIDAETLRTEDIISRINEIQDNKDIKLNLIKMKFSFELASRNISQVASI
jgi:MGT family glycosyltransferase